jgi:hypothetical protein
VGGVGWAHEQHEHGTRVEEIYAYTSVLHDDDDERAKNVLFSADVDGIG